MSIHFSRALTRCCALALTACLSGCGGMFLQFRPFAEPPDTADRARVRIVGNTLVTAMPNSSCSNPSVEGAGTILGSFFGSNGFRERSLGMPGSASVSGDAGEFYVAANAPLTLQLLTTPESRWQCRIAVSFVPEKDQDYEATMLLHNSGICTARIVSLSQPEKKVAFQKVDACR